MKILLDTDIGGDIDDALALSYLLKQPRCNLLGVTTVGGESEKRAALASAVCYAAGRPDIPIHVGAWAPLIVEEHQPSAYQSQALSAEWPYQPFERRNTAVAFLRDTIRAHPHEITLLTIGPLTNIGLLFALDPEIPHLLKSMMVMGGTFTAQENDHEWNIICDPHAAAMAFAASVKQLTSVGLNVTEQCRLPAAECRRHFARAIGPMTFVAEMAEVFFAHEKPEIVFHDPLAAALIFEPALCGTKATRIEVELFDEQRLGRTRAVEGTAVAYTHHIAVTVNAADFLAHFWNIVENKG